MAQESSVRLPLCCPGRSQGVGGRPDPGENIDVGQDGGMADAPSGHRRLRPRGPGSSWQARRTPATDPAPRRSRPTCRRSAAPPAARPAHSRRCCPAPPGRRTRHTAARPRPRRHHGSATRHSLLTAAATSPASGSWCVRRASAIAQAARSSSAMAASMDSGGERCAGLQPAVMPPNSRWTCAVASWAGIPAARSASALSLTGPVSNAPSRHQAR